MRFLVYILPILSISACNAPAQRSAAPVAPAVAAPFSMPMDPGLIRCDQLSNPAALAAATEWTVGRARAAVLAGRLDAVPDSTTVSGRLSDYCGRNGTQNLRTAVAQQGL